MAAASAPSLAHAPPPGFWGRACACWWWPLRRKFRVLWLLTVTGIFCTLPMLLLEMQRHQWSHVFQAWFLAGLFCVLTWTVTLYEVALHLEYYSRPALQKHIIRIMLMPPIYAADSWFCLRFVSARTVLTPIRECYEAYTIYNFFMYLIRYLEGQLGPMSDYMGVRGTTTPHIFPVNYFSTPWVGRELHRKCRSGVLNYVILRPVTAVVMWGTLMTALQRYEEGQFQWGNVWPYCMLINNFSQGWALYVLMLFYVAMYDELKPLNPLRKFVTIKLVVFASFWQGLLITLLAAFGILRPVASLRTYRDTADFTGGLQDFIICIEMFFAAVGFAWSFPPRDYMTGEPPGIWQSVNTVFDFTDVMDDVGDRVHEEYKELTEKPIQKIIAPIRNSPLFVKPPKPKLVSLAGTSGSGVEMMPLGADAQAITGMRGDNYSSGTAHGKASQLSIVRSAAGEASTSAPAEGDSAGLSAAVGGGYAGAGAGSGAAMSEVSRPASALDGLLSPGTSTAPSAEQSSNGGKLSAAGNGKGLRIGAKSKLQAHVD